MQLGSFPDSIECDATQKLISQYEAPRFHFELNIANKFKGNGESMGIDLFEATNRKKAEQIDRNNL